MSNGHGGARPGAGRKRKDETYAAEIESATAKVYRRLDDNVDGLQALASNDRLVVHEEYAPAGTVSIDDVEVDADGRVHKVKRPAFPGKPADELVLVKRRTVNNGPSEAALMYLIDQGLGKPTQALELENGPSGALRIKVEYDDADDQAAPAPSGPTDR